MAAPAAAHDFVASLTKVSTGYAKAAPDESHAYLGHRFSGASRLCVSPAP